jgi:hypothetical protein
MKIKLRQLNLTPDEFEEFLDNLLDTDGYFSSIHIYNEELLGVLKAGDYIENTGFKKYCASHKLLNCSLSHEEFFNLLTGRTYEQLDTFNRRLFKLNEIKKLFILAEKYNYTLIKDVK